jgi:L-fucose mutarotase/ribose pyranase (RbsD/FucU family)
VAPAAAVEAVPVLDADAVPVVAAVDAVVELVRADTAAAAAAPMGVVLATVSTVCSKLLNKLCVVAGVCPDAVVLESSVRASA